jgi:hypothetical protein
MCRVIARDVLVIACAGALSAALRVNRSDISPELIFALTGGPVL